MTRMAVDQILYLLDEAFDGGGWHSLLTNLTTVTLNDWSGPPPGGKRSIRDLVQHVGACKLMYDNHAFGAADLRWGSPAVEGTGRIDSIAAATEWLREGQARLRRSVAALGDADLIRVRKTHWGEMKETRWIVRTMIEHDLYHAGEINHVRALLQQNDS